jgi:O-acetyl-ADP-ribose deacetylase (regulator of RNase III)
MLHEVSGDILLTQASTIAHGVAPGDHMNNGLAFSLRKDWPAMHKDFRHFSHATNPHPGTLWAWAGANGKRIVALFTQQAAADEQSHPKPARIQDVNHCLRALRHFVDEEKLPSLALPRVATGVGGLEWNEVKPLVEEHLGSLKIPVYVYTHFKTGVQAQEPNGN